MEETIHPEAHDATAAELNASANEVKTEVGTDPVTGETVHTDVAPIDADAKPVHQAEPAEDAYGDIAHPTLSEAQAMFRENAGLDSVVIQTDHGDARAYRDSRVELLPPEA